MQCEICGGRLPYDNPYWKRKCVVCFKRIKRLEETAAADDAWGAYFQLKAAYDAIRAELEAVSPTIEDSMLKKLLLLCHPDKHGNSPLSNEVTRYLLSLRKQS